MEDVWSWIQEESPIVVALLLIGSALLFVLRTTVEQTIATQFDALRKELEFELARRSAFKDKVLTERYTLVMELSRGSNASLRHSTGSHRGSRLHRNFWLRDSSFR